jgi:hypothetical protein
MLGEGGSNVDREGEGSVNEGASGAVSTPGVAALHLWLTAGRCLSTEVV